jgi:peptide/nickel transport system permease protein
MSAATVRFAARHRKRVTWPAAFRTWPARIALLVLMVVLAVAFFGRLVAPHSPSALVGAPFSPPSGRFPLGTDYLGEDVLSRVLYGGQSVILFALIATCAAYVVGGSAGLLAGLSRTMLDPILMRAADVLLAFPSLVLVLLLAARFGASSTVVVIGVALIHIPLVARVVRTATLETSVTGYVEAALARGDSTVAILRRQILPNITSVVVADAGPRLAASILLIAGLDYLGIGASPPSPDWALMINENISGVRVNVWPVLAPALLIAAATVSVNILADAVAQSRGRSWEESFKR